MTPKFEKCIAVTLRWEGGLSENPNDKGGITKYGISQRAYPQLDIRNLTLEQAKEIYYRDYWLAAGCETLDEPLALAHFDFTVNSGLTRSTNCLKATQDYVTYNLIRLDFLSKLEQFPTFGRGWTRRVIDVLNQGHKWYLERPWILTIDNNAQGNDILVRVSPGNKKAFMRRD